MNDWVGEIGKIEKKSHGQEGDPPTQVSTTKMAKEGKDVGKKSKASVKTPEVKPKSTSKKSSDEAWN